MITQELRENILDMKSRGLTNSNISAITGVDESAVEVVVGQIQVPRVPKKKVMEAKPDIPFVHPESVGVEENWEVEGLCRTSGYPDMWFPKPTDFSSIKLAQRVCYRCPIIMECRSMALARGEQHGIWGGLTELQRRRIRKANRLREIEGEEAAG